MERILNTMQDPDKLSDPRATVVQTAGDVASFPQIPGYRVVKKLGQGGMATVYMATQESLDRPVSITVMERETLQDETSMQRFENEARTIAKLTHPSIVSIYEVGRTADGRMYYSMPYLPNGDLAQRDLGKDDPRVIALLRTLLSALDYAHTRGVVHRDVKQENVLFDSDNRPLLADFGIALSKADAVRITTAGLAVGSSGYMAPEQARGDAVDGRADLYSVGVLAYELLTGELPYRSNDALALALMHVQKEIPRLPAAKRHWQPFIDRAMAKSPDDRFENAKQMLDAIDRIDRRSGNHLSQRMLRTLDRTAPGNGWKRPRMLAFVGALLLAGGLYAMRDRLPFVGSSANSTQPQASATSATAAASTPASSPAAATNATPTTTAPPAAAPVAAAPPPPAPATPPATPPATESASQPATTPATPAATTPNAPPSTAATVALGNARAALGRGYLMAPPGKNAVDLARAAWELSPATPDTNRLVDDVLKELSAQEVLAIRRANDARAIECQQKAAMLANATVGQSAPAWHALRDAGSAALLDRARTESSAADNGAIAQTQALARQLDLPQALAAIPVRSSAQVGQPATQTTTATDHQAQVPSNTSSPQGPSASTRADVGPGFVKLHGPIMGFPAAAIANAEVTRRDYAAFANATHRAPADCSVSKAERAEDVPPQRFGSGTGRFGQGFRRARASQAAGFGSDEASSDKSWSNPGYSQKNDHPVVCVSWEDANAYAKWLSQRTGNSYRLPAASEWRMAIASGVGNASSGHGTIAALSGSPNSLGLYGLDGNVSEWLLDCALGCERRQVAGRSWRDHGTDQVPAGRKKERAFDDVGFRLVEVLGVRK